MREVQTFSTSHYELSKTEDNSNAECFLGFPKEWFSLLTISLRTLVMSWLVFPPFIIIAVLRSSTSLGARLSRNRFERFVFGVLVKIISEIIRICSLFFSPFLACFKYVGIVLCSFLHSLWKHLEIGLNSSLGWWLVECHAFRKVAKWMDRRFYRVIFITNWLFQ